MDGHTECLAYGAIISFLVSLLKKITFIKNNPKMTAAVLSALTVAAVTYFGVEGTEWATAARCLVETFAASVATHEAIVQPVKDTLITRGE